MIDVEIASPFYPDLSGAPLQNGSVYYGASGQNPVTSQVSVYWDANGTQPAKQPIRVMNGLPARNGSPALVYISGDYSKLVLDGRGRQVSYVAAQSSRNLDTLPFTQAGVGAISMSAQAALRAAALTPEQFGAVGDGVTDDTAAMTKAWNAVLAVRGRLALGPKVYRITAPLPTITVPCAIVGHGSHKSWIKYDKSANGNAITTRNVWLGASSAARLDPNGDTFDPADERTGAEFRGFTILGDRSTPNPQGGLIHLDRADNLIVDDIHVYNIKGVGWGFAAGASNNACLRESALGEIQVRRCGNQAAGIPAVHLYTNGDGASGNDASNQVSIRSLHSIWPDGGALKLENTNTTQPARYIEIKHCMFHGRDVSGTNPQTVPMVQVIGDWYSCCIAGMEINGLRDGMWGVVLDRDPTTLKFPRNFSIGGSVGSGSGAGSGIWIKYGKMLHLDMYDIAVSGTALKMDSTISGPVILDAYGSDASWVYDIADANTQNQLVREHKGLRVSNPADTNGYFAEFKSSTVTNDPAILEVFSTAKGVRNAIVLRDVGFAELPQGYKFPPRDPTTFTDDPFQAYRELRGSQSAWIFQSSAASQRTALAWLTAPPADGAWFQGDRIYNLRPAVGAPKSWVCTAAGTPGTWVSEGNL